MEKERSHLSDHFANERTFLAWIRTAIAIMAFGFVVAKFTLFVRQLSLAIGNEGAVHHVGRYSGLFGILLVSFGLITALLAFIRYRRIRQGIEEENFQHTQSLPVLFTAAVIISGVLLLLYLALNS